jgi:hypothetical protein
LSETCCGDDIYKYDITKGSCIHTEKKTMILILSVALLILIGLSTGNGPSSAYALANKTSVDFATVETLGKSYSFGLDYTALLNKSQIVKNENSEEDVINASRRDIMRGVFNSPDRDQIEYFDAFLIKEHRIRVNFENGTLGFSRQHHLINLQCNTNDTNDSCYSFYGEFPFRKQPAEYMLVLVAYYSNYLKYYITKVNLS